MQSFISFPPDRFTFPGFFGTIQEKLCKEYSMLEKLKAVENRFEELCAKSEHPDFYADPNRPPSC